LIGAQASEEIWTAIDIWLTHNPTKSVTDFLLAAIMEKLDREKIPYNRIAAQRDGRARRPRLEVSYLNDQPSSKPLSDDQRIAKKA